MPIVGTNLFAVPEVVRDVENGFIVKIPGYNLKDEYTQSFPTEKMRGGVEKKFVHDCYNALSKLIESKSLREKMGRDGFKGISKGYLSVDTRNKTLRKIYEEAIK